MRPGFSTPSDHVNFEAKQLCGALGAIRDGSIAYIQKRGGGPVTPHTHAHDHLFIVVKGEAQITMQDETFLVKENESFLVKGVVPHAIWSNTDAETVMIGISLMP